MRKSCVDPSRQRRRLSRNDQTISKCKLTIVQEHILWHRGTPRARINQRAVLFLHLNSVRPSSFFVNLHGWIYSRSFDQLVIARLMIRFSSLDVCTVTDGIDVENNRNTLFPNDSPTLTNYLE